MWPAPSEIKKVQSQQRAGLQETQIAVVFCMPKSSPLRPGRSCPAAERRRQCPARRLEVGAAIQGGGGTTKGVPVQKGGGGDFAGTAASARGDDNGATRHGPSVLCSVRGGYLEKL
jgi:hypothetical protein